MSNAISKTLARLGSVSRNMLINPYFEHVDVPRTTANVGLNFLPTANAELFRFAPGWFTYGAASSGDFGRPTNYDFPATDNPFAANTNGERVNQSNVTNDQRYGNGLTIEQEAGRDFGIVQPILRGAALKRAKKVRISGCYQVLQNDGAGGLTSDVAGIHIYLKKELRAINIGNAQVSDVAGTSSSL